MEDGSGLDTVATGPVRADLVRKFAEASSRSLTVETTSADAATEIRVGNAGIARSFSNFATGCGDIPTARRTDLRREAVAQPPR